MRHGGIKWNSSSAGSKQSTGVSMKDCPIERIPANESTNWFKGKSLGNHCKGVLTMTVPNIFLEYGSNMLKQRSGINLWDRVASWDAPRNRSVLDAGYPMDGLLRGVRNNVVKNQMIYFWLVVLTILKNISQWEGLSNIYIYIYCIMENNMFQTTNQIWCLACSWNSNCFIMFYLLLGISLASNVFKIKLLIGMVLYVRYLSNLMV